jgi:hypothetical protein
MSNTATATATTATIGATVWLSEDTYNTCKVIADRWEAYELPEGGMLLESWNGYITIGVLTGRTRRFFGNIVCPTIDRYEVETFATADGVIMGRMGDRIAGTSAIRPEMIG